MQSRELFECLSPTPSRLRLPAGSRVRVNAGTLWLTVQGQGDDIWLRCGEHWQASADVLVWLSGVPTADFELVRPVRQVPARASLRAPDRLRWV